MIEKELKALLSKDQYDMIIKLFDWHEIRTQTNYYYADKEDQNKNKGITIRVRKYENKVLLQIKVPISEDLKDGQEQKLKEEQSSSQGTLQPKEEHKDPQETLQPKEEYKDRQEILQSNEKYKDGQGALHLSNEYEVELNKIPEEIDGVFLSNICKVSLPDVIKMGHLTTVRHIYNWNDKTEISLDKNNYLDTEDYEIEIEYKENIDPALIELFEKNNIKFQNKTDGKCKRFFSRLKNIY